jgi:microcystin-dependent protein
VSTFIVVDQGEEDWLDLVLAVNYTLHLFTNEVTAGLTPEQIDALDETDLDEATFAGYASAALTGGSWTTTPGNPTTGVYAEQSFVRSSTGAPQDIWGYYLTRTSDGELQGFEQFDAPITVELINDEIEVTPRITLGDEVENVNPTGSISGYAAATAPDGWLLCDGTAVSRSTFAALFAVIGTTYGVGDGSTTFNLPDLRQRFPLGKAAAGTGATLGDTGGDIDHVHNLANDDAFAMHTGVAAATENYRIRRIATDNWTSSHQADTGAGLAAPASNPQTTGVALGGDTDTENPPFQVVNFIIKT